MKRGLLFIICFLQIAQSFACTVCKSQQPKGFQGITHGTGPGGTLDYIIILSAVILVLFTLVMSVIYLVKPREENSNHIKNLILHDNQS